jgi:hypothetical protein
MTGVRVRAPGPTGLGTTLTDADTGQEIKGVARLSINVEPDDFIRVEAELLSASLDVMGEAEFRVADPETGEIKRISRIEFEDGSVWNG